MPIFESEKRAADVFGATYSALAGDEVFAKALKEGQITIKFIHANPEFRLFVSGEGVLTGDQVPERATLTIKMSSDTAHELWSGQLSFPAGITGGRIKILGKVSRVLEVMPSLVPIFEIYPRIAANFGIIDLQS
jgi:putative sterol carrier protein